MPYAFPIRFRKATCVDTERRRMRITYGATFYVNSPIAPLLGPLAASVGQIVPEREAEFRRILKEHGIAIEIDVVSQDFYIGAHVKEKYVTAALAALERIWAYTYFYLATLELLRKHGPGVEIDLAAIPEVQPARNLAIWALICEKNKRQTPWPEGLPMPDTDASSDDRIGLTNAYFQNALCFIVLHEVGHIVRKHYPSRFEDPQSAYKCEFEADAWAARFMLKKCLSTGRQEKEFIGRCTGIALGLAMLAGVELYHHAAKDDHPTIAERLLRFFQKYIPESTGPQAPTREFPMYVATAIIHGHFQNAGVPFELLKSFADFTTYLIHAHRAMVEHRR